MLKLILSGLSPSGVSGHAEFISVAALALPSRKAAAFANDSSGDFLPLSACAARLTPRVLLRANVLFTG
ncbi:hypothetical protein CLOLEP_02536 [[Clostridium] leptum DSM 753]|uniref:Uncharacterized protein n=1 Tax=[Clostridium] leptum DSM 753 TaxID=428125 RepID=A7VVC4_9FIRM|nr:hypothetical protein CLOLEP_02536 [[Clostridium] leptum DSM 753]